MSCSCWHQEKKFEILHSFSTSSLGRKTIRLRAARLLIVLRPKLNVESEHKWQNCYLVALQHGVFQLNG